jgi:hypothetical protein
MFLFLLFGDIVFLNELKVRPFVIYGGKQSKIIDWLTVFLFVRMRPFRELF